MVKLIKNVFPDKNISWKISNYRPLPPIESVEVENRLIREALEKKSFRSKEKREWYYRSLKL
jgi:hypothetical protein